MWETLIIEPMVNSLLVIYRFIGNFGIAIILFTILIRLLTHPLTAQQLKSTHKMQEFQKSKEWIELQKKYKDDKAKLQQEQMKMYQQMGINPLGSCLPLLIQFPIIIGLYQSIVRVLGGAPIQLADLYHLVYPFINISKLVPINNIFLGINLSQPLGYTVLGFIMAAFVAGTTWIQSKVMAPPAQPGEQGAQMSQAMNMYMPLLMGYLALTFASGLSLYFVTGNIISIAQYAFMGKVNWSNLLPSRIKIPGLPAKTSTPEAVVEDKPEKTTKKSSSGTTSKKASAKK